MDIKLLFALYVGHYWTVQVSLLSYSLSKAALSYR